VELGEVIVSSFKNHKDIEYRLLDQDSFQASLDCIVEVFLKSEPITSLMKVGVGEFLPFASGLLRHALGQGLSWVAVDRITGEVAGIRVTTKLDEDFEPRVSFGPKMDVVVEFLSSVSEQGRPLLACSPKKSVHSHMVAVDSRYQGLGVAKTLLERASFWAWWKGYETSVGEVTSAFNQRILSKIPSYKAIHRVSYQEFQKDGRRPFEALKDHSECVLFQFDLSDFSQGVQS